MNKKISKLTPSQEAKIPEFITKWVSQASKPTDRILATKAVKDMYKSMGQDEPIVVFGQSPYAATLMAALVFALIKPEASKSGGQLYDQLRDQLRVQLRDQLRGQLYDQLAVQLYDQLDGQLRDQLRDQLAVQLYDQLDVQLRDQLDGQLRGQLAVQLYGQLRDQLRVQLKDINKNWYMTTFWLAWAGWYDYGQYIGVEFDKEKFSLFSAFVANVGFIIPYKGIAFVSEAPQKIVWNEQKRLSFDHDMAAKYADGWGVYCLDGVRFEKDEWQKIVDQTFTLEDLAKAGMGADKSAVAIKYLRPDRLLEHCKAMLVHTGVKGTQLYEVPNFMSTGTTQYCMRMKHPTVDREYIEWVHPDVGRQGNADLAQCAAWRDKDGDPIPLEDYLLALSA